MNAKPLRTGRRILAAGIAGLLTTVSTLHAQTWDGGGANNSFTNAGNWNPNLAPVNDGTADIVFSGSVRPTPTVNIDYSVNSVAFDNVAVPFTINAAGGSTLTIGAGGIANNSPNTQTFSAPVVFQSDSSISGGNPLNFTGGTDIGSGIVSVIVNATTSFDGLTGTGTLVKNGVATLNLQSSGTQDYSITVNSGSLLLGSFPTFGPTSTIAVNGGELGLSITTLDGATLTRSATGTFRTGTTFRAQNGATVDIAGTFATNASFYEVTGAGTTFMADDFDIVNGSEFRVLEGATATVTDRCDVGIGTDGSLVVSGPGSSLTTSLLPFASFGSIGGNANVTVSDGGVADINTILTVGGGNGGSANVTVSGGGQLSPQVLVVGAFMSGDTTITVSGSGSRLSTTATDVTVGNKSSAGASIVNLESGGELFPNRDLFLQEGGTINVVGGIISINDGGEFVIDGTLNFVAGRINLGEDFGVAGAGNDLLGGNVVLGPGREVTVPDGRTTTVGTGGALVLDGGLLRTGTLANAGGTIDFRRGRLEITGAGTFSIGSAGPLGSNVTVPGGATLGLGDAEVDPGASLFIDGGVFSAADLANGGSVLVERGTATVTSLANNAGAQLVVAGALNNPGAFSNDAGARLELANGTGLVLGGSILTNDGLLTGHGTIAKATTNTATGEIRAEIGRTLFFTGGFNANAGELNLQGGTIDIAGPVTNSAGGFISGRGALRTGGLTNDGQMAFSGGTTDIRGDVTLNSGSRVVTGGAGSVTTFFDDVVHNGQEIFTGAGASTVFFGDQSGAGPFTGTGTVYYIGDLRPGNSPGIVSYGGDLIFGGAASLVLEIGGVHPGDSDHLEVAGTLFADGILTLSLFDGFLPEAGNSFDLLDAAGFAGEFDFIQTPALPGGLEWDAGGLASTGTVRVVPEPGVAGLALLGASLLGLRRRVCHRERSAAGGSGKVGAAAARSRTTRFQVNRVPD